MQKHYIRPRIAALLAALMLLAGQGRAWGQGSSATPTPPYTAETHLGRGYDALKQERFEAAVSEFRAALELDPALGLRARFPLAEALFEMHKPAEARQEFEAMHREVGDHPNVLYYLGRLDLEDRDFAGAIAKLSKAAVKPPFPDTAYYLGFAYLKQGDLPAAEKWLKEAAQLDPQDARIPYQLVAVYRREGREEEAKKAVELSEELHRRDDKASQLRMECAQKLDQGPREEAHAFCDQLYDPDNADKLTELGTIYGQHGDFVAALKPLQRAAELAPQSPQMQYNLARVYYDLGQFNDARAPLEGALKRWPDLFPLNSLYGAVLYKLGEDASAYQALRHAWQLNPQDSGTEDLLYLTTLRVGRHSRDKKQYGEALHYFEEAAKLKPQEPEPHRSMAEVYASMGQTDQATAEQREAIRLRKALEK